MLNMQPKEFLSLSITSKFEPIVIKWVNVTCFHNISNVVNTITFELKRGLVNTKEVVSKNNSLFLNN